MTLVIIDEPKGTYYGGTIAGPVMKEVLANALPYLGVKPDYTDVEQTLDEVQKVTVPEFKNLKCSEAKKLASDQGVQIELQGEGEEILSQFPLAGETINKTTKIILYTS